MAQTYTIVWSEEKQRGACVFRLRVNQREQRVMAVEDVQIVPANDAAQRRTPSDWPHRLGACTVTLENGEGELCRIAFPCSGVFEPIVLAEGKVIAIDRVAVTAGNGPVYQLTKPTHVRPRFFPF